MALPRAGAEDPGTSPIAQIAPTVPQDLIANDTTITANRDHAIAKKNKPDGAQEAVSRIRPATMTRTLNAAPTRTARVARESGDSAIHDPVSVRGAIATPSP